jgi:hypothetical protein
MAEIVLLVIFKRPFLSSRRECCGGYSSLQWPRSTCDRAARTLAGLQMGSNKA